ncbi:hypothetical protein EDD85DRAFT_976230 [Armillaria nabsnona]|nr:hypothetical protein EDD85DRAFT_976230 [Armillaria nabsnona]
MSHRVLGICGPAILLEASLPLVPHPNPARLVNVITVGRGDDGDDVHMGGLCNELETLKVGVGHLRARWMRFLFRRDGVISLANLRELVFPVTSEVDSWMPGVHELFGRAPRLETAMLLDWRGSHQNLDHITPIPHISNLRSLTVFVPLAYTDRYEVRRALVSNNTKVDTADTAICALDCTRRMLDTGTRLEDVVLIVNASSVVNDEGVRVAWGRLLRPNVVMTACRVFLHCPETHLIRLKIRGTVEDSTCCDWYKTLVLLCRSTRATMDNQGRITELKRQMSRSSSTMRLFNDIILTPISEFNSTEYQLKPNDADFIIDIVSRSNPTCNGYHYRSHFDSFQRARSIRGIAGHEMEAASEAHGMYPALQHYSLPAVT